MKTLGQTIKGKRESLNLTQRYIAEQLGYSSPQFITNWEADKSSVPIAKLKKLCSVLDLNVEEILKSYYQEFKDLLVKDSSPEYVPHPGKKQIPVFPGAQCGEMIDWEDGNYPVGVSDNYVDYDGKDPHAFAVVAKGDSMTGFGIHEGSTIIIEPMYHTPDPLNGKVVFCRCNEHGCAIKQLFMHDGFIQLKSGNPNHQDIIITQDHAKEIRCYKVKQVRTDF